MVVARIIVVTRLSPVDLPVINVPIMLVTIMALDVTMVTPPPIPISSTTVIMFVRNPDLGLRRVLRVNQLKVDFPEVLVDPQ